MECSSIIDCQRECFAAQYCVSIVGELVNICDFDILIDDSGSGITRKDRWELHISIRFDDRSSKR